MGQARKKYILLIIVDDLNGCVMPGHPLHSILMDHQLIPNLSRIFKTGTSFINCFTAIPGCGPSRASLLHGLHPISTNGYDLWSLNDRLVNDHFGGRRSLFYHLKKPAFGYRTYGAGKIFHHKYTEFEGESRGAGSDPVSQQETQARLEQEWRKDDWTMFRDFGEFPKFKRINPPVTRFVPSDLDWQIRPDRTVGTEPPDALMNEYLCDAFVKDIKNNPDAPFALAVGYYKPHLPFYIEKRYLDRVPLSIPLPDPRHSADLHDVPEFAKMIAQFDGSHDMIISQLQWQQVIRGYLACINFVDECIGQLYDRLAAEGLLQDTLIVLCSDNGFELGGKHAWRKFKLWDESTRVPLFMAGPGILPNRLCERVVSTMDIFPTLLDLTGSSLDVGGFSRDPVFSRSLRPLLENPGQQDSEWRGLAFSSWKTSDLNTELGRLYMGHSIRTEKWRYTFYVDLKDPGNNPMQEELYDHSLDHAELINLLADPEGCQRSAALRDKFSAPLLTSLKNALGGEQNASIKIWPR